MKQTKIFFALVAVVLFVACGDAVARESIEGLIPCLNQV